LTTPQKDRCDAKKLLFKGQTGTLPKKLDKTFRIVRAFGSTVGRTKRLKRTVEEIEASNQSKIKI